VAADRAAWSGAAALTAAGTVLEALAALGANRIGFAAPFLAEIGEASLRYLAACGVEVVATRFGGLRDNFGIAEMPRDAIIEFACGADHPAA
jgi:maleate cis-trans isomerase